MSEGRIAEPRRRKSRARAPTTPDPIDIAMEAEASGRPATGAAHDLLIEQRRLIGWQIASERFGVALKAMTIFVGLGLVGILGAMAWSAAQDRGVVVRALNTPPAYAARGLSGEVLAGRLMDDLIVIRARTARVSIAPSQDLRAPSDDVRIDIPQTGVSLGEIQRLFERWFGHQTVIVGSLSEDAPGVVTLSARVGRYGWVRVSGPANQLDALIHQLAEKSFAAYDPTQWVVYLGAENRPDEALAAAKFNIANNPARDATLARDYSIWAGREGDPARQVQLFRKAISLGPRQIIFRRNIARAYERSGDEQAAFDAAAVVPTLRGSDQSRLYEQPLKIVIEKLRRGAGYTAASMSGAYAQARALADPGLEETLAAARAHDGLTARQLVAEALELRKITPRDAAFTGVHVAWATGNWPAMATAMATYEREREIAFQTPLAQGLPPPSASPVRQVQYAAQRARRDDPLLAETLARTGDIEGARAAAAATPLDCAACLRARAEVESAARNWPAADVWYARAAAFAPRLPQAETLWGASLLARGDAQGAIAKFTAASGKGPHFADPLELWGEALMASGDAKAASGKFAEAAKFAPRWGRLHLKWGEALAALGKPDEARAKWRAAAGMDLAPADRARLDQRLAGRA
jgi:tetratricopeptide (TPR) repeat protein